MAVVLLTGFSCGIPLALSGATLQAWMASAKVDLAIIGVFSLVGLPYTVKFLWSPFMDRYIPPFLGRRRGWMIVSQLSVAVAVSMMAFSNPVTNPEIMALLAILVAFFSASQDIAVDAYRTEILKPEELGAGSGIYVMGYRIAMLCSGALSLIMSDHLQWKTVYLIMAGTMLIGVITTLSASEPEIKDKPPNSIKDAIIHPFIDFFQRRGAFEILVFILLYKIDTAVAGSLITPFMLQLGFTKTDIGAVMKGFGFFATIAGTLVGGAVMVRLKMRLSLLIFGILQGIAGFSFMLLAYLGHNYPMMMIAITVENFFSGAGTAAFDAFIMSCCNKKFTATQYALLTSFMAFTRVIVGAPTGWLAKNVGWEMYFFISVLLSIPGLLMLFRFNKWTNLRES